MSKDAIKLQADIVSATAKLYELGFRIQCNYIYGAGWASEIVNINNGESFQDDYQAKLDAKQEKNNDYAIDNMTCDISPEEQELMDLENASLDQFNQERCTVIDDVGQMYDPTERLKMEEENE